jgi:hypothetical protein
MLHAMESRWRYPIAILLGLGVGTWIGAAIATLYLMARFGEDLGGFDIFELWLLNLSDPRIKANPAVEHTAWLITALPALFWRRQERHPFIAGRSPIMMMRISSRVPSSAATVCRLLFPRTAFCSASSGHLRPARPSCLPRQIAFHTQ